jgi:hypothetical protein
MAAGSRSSKVGVWNDFQGQITKALMLQSGCGEKAWQKDN